MKIIFKLSNLALFAALVSCGKSRDEELKAIKAAQQSLFVAVSESAPLIQEANEVSDVAVQTGLLNDPEVWKSLKEKMETIEGVDNKQLKNLKGWFDASLIHSGELIKKSKPSSNDLKEAHKKLSDFHTKFEVFLSVVDNPDGSLSSYNEKVASFKQDLREFMSWWKREIIF